MIISINMYKFGVYFSGPCGVVHPALPSAAHVCFYQKVDFCCCLWIHVFHNHHPISRFTAYYFKVKIVPSRLISSLFKSKIHVAIGERS